MARIARRWLALAVGLAAIGVAAGTWYLVRRPAGRTPCSALRRSDQKPCYTKLFNERLERAGVADAMATLKAMAALDQGVEREGHVFAHGIGIEAYQRKRSVPETFEPCTTDFASGCAHGVIQAYLESQSAVDSATINALCAPYHEPGRSRWQLFQCVHGMGHGLEMFYGHDLPQAIASCDRLLWGWDRESCWGGAFMENIMHEIAPHHPATELVASHGHANHSRFKALDPTDLLYPCSIMAQKYLRSCYEIQTAAILHFTRRNLKRTAKVCDTAPPDMRPACYQSLGRDITSHALRNPDKSFKFCKMGTEAYRPWCYVGVVKSLIDWNANSAAGLTFCQRLGEITGALRCYRAAGEQIAALEAAAAKREKRCAEAGRVEAVAACRYGAGLPGGSLPPSEN